MILVDDAAAAVTDEAAEAESTSGGGAEAGELRGASGLVALAIEVASAAEALEEGVAECDMERQTAPEANATRGLADKQTQQRTRSERDRVGWQSSAVIVAPIASKHGTNTKEGERRVQ